MADRFIWLSFVDTDEEPGARFLGVSVVRVSPTDVERSQQYLAVHYPHANADAALAHAAMRKAHELGCNPGGDVSSTEIPQAAVEARNIPIGKLMPYGEVKARNLI